MSFKIKCRVIPAALADFFSSLETVFRPKRILLENGLYPLMRAHIKDFNETQKREPEKCDSVLETIAHDLEQHSHDDLIAAFAVKEPVFGDTLAHEMAKTADPTMAALALKYGGEDLFYTTANKYNLTPSQIATIHGLGSAKTPQGPKLVR